MPDIKYIERKTLMAMESMTDEVADYLIPEKQLLPVVFGRRGALEYIMRIGDGMLLDYIEAHPEHANLKEPCYMFTGAKTIVYASEVINGINEDGNATATIKTYYLGFIDHDAFETFYLADGINTVRNVAQHDVIIQNCKNMIHFAGDEKPADWKDSITNLANSQEEGYTKAIDDLWFYLIMKSRRGEIELSPQWSNIYSGAGYANFYRWCAEQGFRINSTLVMPESGEVGPNSCSINLEETEEKTEEEPSDKVD